MLDRRLTALRIAAALVVLLALSGCWDNKDINHRSLPIVMGISKKGDVYKIILQIPEPGRTDSQMRTVEQTGSTISEIVDRISANMESQVDLLHLKIILIDRKFAEEGIRDSVATFIRASEISPKTMAVICDEPLEQFFRNINGFNKNHGAVLFDFFSKDAGWNPQIVQTHIWEIFRSIHSYTNDEAIPIVKSGNGTVIECVGSGILRNGKLVGRISNDETLLLNTFSGVSARGKIEIMNHATVQILDDTVSHRGVMMEGKPMLKSKIHLKVSLLETKGTPSEEQIGYEMEQLMAGRFRELFMKLKSRQADVLAVGQYFRSRLTREQLENWRTDFYPDMEIDIKFDIIIQNEGNLRVIGY